MEDPYLIKAWIEREKQEKESLEKKVAEPTNHISKNMLTAGILGTGVYALGSLVVHSCYPEEKYLVGFINTLLIGGMGYITGAGLVYILKAGGGKGND